MLTNLNIYEGVVHWLKDNDLELNQFRRTKLSHNTNKKLFIILYNHYLLNKAITIIMMGQQKWSLLYIGLFEGYCILSSSGNLQSQIKFECLVTHPQIP
jgi:hypothetical protein